MFIKEPKTTAELTYGDIINRYYKLENVKGLTGEKLTYARSKNLMHLRSFEKANSTAVRIPITDGYAAYRNKLGELERKYLLTDKEGKTVLVNGGPAIDMANPKFIKETEDLKKKHKADIEEREADIKAYTDFLNDPVPEKELPAVHMIEKGEATDLDQDQLEAIFWMIKE